MGGGERVANLTSSTQNTSKGVLAVISLRLCILCYTFYERLNFLVFEIDKTTFWYIIYNTLNFFESLKIVLINMVTILMMSAKMIALGVLKRKVMTSPTKFYHVIQGWSRF